MVTSRLDNTYTGVLLPAIKQVNEVLPPPSDGRSPGQDHASSLSDARHRMPVRVNRPETQGQRISYDRSSAAVSVRHSIGPRVYVEKGSYVNTWV